MPRWPSRSTRRPAATVDKLLGKAALMRDLSLQKSGRTGQAGSDDMLTSC